MAFLSQRRRRPEIMDQPDLSPRRHLHALRGLARINFWSRSAGILWPPLCALAREIGRVRVLDLATGGGDVPLRLWQRARRHGLAMEMAGCDISPVAIEHARSMADQAGAQVHFFVQDALTGPPASGYDVAISSLFLHHLDEDQALVFLRRMAETARCLVLVNDLVRSWPGWMLAHVGTRLLSTSDVVHFDGPRSVEGAFTLAEVCSLAERAGLHGASVHRRWPCRYLLTWRRA
jgi:2-polyprenyl-3-methyl-5-hydroxy-6-metoxy-1,4-benzoquinol methylase